MGHDGTTWRIVDQGFKCNSQLSKFSWKYTFISCCNVIFLGLNHLPSSDGLAPISCDGKGDHEILNVDFFGCLMFGDQPTFIWLVSICFNHRLFPTYLGRQQVWKHLTKNNKPFLMNDLDNYRIS